MREPVTEQRPHQIRGLFSSESSFAGAGRRLTDGWSLRRLSPCRTWIGSTIEPGKRSGKPCIRGLRMTISDVLDYLVSGMSENDLLRDFPDLTREDIRACLAFAADRERRLVAVGGR